MHAWTLPFRQLRCLSACHMAQVFPDAALLNKQYKTWWQLKCAHHHKG